MLSGAVAPDRARYLEKIAETFQEFAGQLEMGGRIALAFCATVNRV